jgi:hypothetical protein
LRFQLNKLSLVLSLGDEGSRGAAAFLASAAAAEDPMKSILGKGNYMTLESGIQLPLPLIR